MHTTSSEITQAMNFDVFPPFPPPFFKPVETDISLYLLGHIYQVRSPRPAHCHEEVAAGEAGVGGVP